MRQFALVLLTLSTLRPLLAEDFTANWMLGVRQENARSITQITWNLRSDSGRFDNTYEFNLADLRGLTPQQLNSAPAVIVRFDIVRAAGTLHCEGYVGNGKGSGSMISFQANPAFAAEMRALGYDNLDDETILLMAIYDVSPQCVRDLQALNIRVKTADQLIRLRRSDVTLAYIQELRSHGQEISNPGRLIELRRGGVGPDEFPGIDAVIAMRTNGVTAEVIREYESLGYGSLDAQTLVAMRIHRVTPAFIREVTELGFPDVPAQQLIAMRVWGVTPEYIQKQKALGTKLTIEKLVQMRVLGID